MAQSNERLTLAPAKGNMMERKPLITGGKGLKWLTSHIAGIVEQRAPMWWWILVIITGAFAALVPILIGYQVSTGVGVWGLNHPVGWAWDITNFVFWIGIGHAGTLISAILFLTRQYWRTAVNRSAEAMTIFAVICAGLFPAFHVGRVWFAWFLFPIPQSNEIWQNFKSPLLWDVFAVSTYFTVSVIFWYIGLIPDLATIRDRATSKIKQWAYGIAAMGWRGSNRQWSNYEKAYLILAGISTPLVLSVHSVVSFDFATSVIPGWHTTIFPPYFVAGAIFGGFAMVLTLLIPCRWIFKLHDVITDKHIDNMCKIILLTGTIVGYAYGMEFFIAWYGGNPYENYAFMNRAFGPYWWSYWAMITCNVLAPQMFWFKYCRRNWIIIYIVINFVNAGMWFERFVIIVTSLHRDFLPSAWGYFSPSWVDIWTFVGTIGLFSFLFLIFLKFLPLITIFEVKAVLPESNPHNYEEPKHGDHKH
jgi:molybdopterin-containing oxidoreductase family membrane subunit